MSIWIGSYREKGGLGLYPLYRKPDGFVAGAPEPAIQNASFAVWSDRCRTAYFVDELEEGRISAWRYREGWQHVATIPSGGSLPCYLALSSDNRWLACANYGDGSIAIFRIDLDTGAPFERVASFKGIGHGPSLDRQDGPHAHCVVFAEGDRALYHVDLGLDRIFRHELSDGNIVGSDTAFTAPAGAGPRHLLFLPDGRALLVCELSAELMLLGPEGSKLKCLDAVPTSPDPSAANNLGGHLLLDPSGDILVTNRGHDSLVRFEANRDLLQLSAWQRTGGSSPRHLLILDDHAIVAHEEGGGVTSVALRGTNDEHAQTIACISGAAFVFDIPDKVDGRIAEA